MLINTSKTSLLRVARLPASIQYIKQYTGVQPFHTSAKALNAALPAPALPLPNNVDAAETTRFSPQRSRDMSDNIMVMSHAPISMIDITTDNSMTAAEAYSSSSPISQDQHLQSYDCFGAVSLNAVMQSNVPTPFGGMHKFSHLNMPGGQWSQEYKFTSQNMHSSHYRALRESTRADWVTYDQNATVTGKGIRRCYSTQASSSPKAEGTTVAAAAPKVESIPVATGTKEPEKLSKKEQLKKAFKEYGATIVTFHVGISLISLGGFYLLVSSGINMMPVLEFLGIESSAIAEKIAVGSTFVTAYAIHKVFAPVRISITLGSTPFIVRFLRAKGFLKPKNKST